MLSVIFLFAIILFQQIIKKHVAQRLLGKLIFHRYILTVEEKDFSKAGDSTAIRK